MNSVENQRCLYTTMGFSHNNNSVTVGVTLIHAVSTMTALVNIHPDYRRRKYFTKVSQIDCQTIYFPMLSLYQGGWI